MAKVLHVVFKLSELCFIKILFDFFFFFFFFFSDGCLQRQKEKRTLVIVQKLFPSSRFPSIIYQSVTERRRNNC